MARQRLFHSRAKMPPGRSYSKKPYGNRTYTPYRKANYPRRGTRPSTGGSSWYSTAAKALSIAMGLKRLINVEVKNFDTNSTAAPDTTGAVIELNSIAQGDTAVTRDGRSIKMTSLTGRIKYSLHASATTSAIRHIILLDTQPSATALTAADILAPSSTTGLIDLAVFPGNRIKILRDKTYVISSGNEKTVEDKFYIPLDLKTKYADGTSNVTQNRINVLHISDEATNVPAQNSNYRVRFVDN